MNSEQLRHVAIIMDGNNRWAKREGKKGVAGHRAGVERIREVLEACRRNSIEVLTVFAFSSENWRRPPKEVEALMGLFYTYLKREARQLAEQNVRLKVIGNRSRFSDRLLYAIEEGESIASQGANTLVIAADYGGKWDIAEAMRKIAQKTIDGCLDATAIDELTLDQHVSTAELPPLDLLIRTGGEMRISNFLLWQAAYAELYFTPLLWPEFGADALNDAVEDFYRRQRRFGLTSDQLDIAQPKGSAGA